MADQEFDPALKESVEAAWTRFIDLMAPDRGDLFGCALKLTGNPFDAEDLVHDALLKGFAAMPAQYGRVYSPRAYMFRILTNLWIDQTRRARPVATVEEAHDMEDTAMAADDTVAVREAAETLLAVLPPRERAALVLKELCGFSHRDVAELLSSTESAVKTALHRGRRRLAAHRDNPPQQPERAPRASRDLVERFVAAMRAHDLGAIKALVVDSLEAGTFPSGTGVGVEFHEKEGWLNGCFYHHIPWRVETGTPFPLDLEVHDWAGESVVLSFRETGDEGRVLEEIWRLEEIDGRVARIRDYCFCPDLVRHVADSLGAPFKAVGYRFEEDIFEDAVEG